MRALPALLLALVLQGSQVSAETVLVLAPDVARLEHQLTTLVKKQPGLKPVDAARAKAAMHRLKWRPTDYGSAARRAKLLSAVKADAMLLARPKPKTRGKVLAWLFARGGERTWGGVLEGTPTGELGGDGSAATTEALAGQFAQSAPRPPSGPVLDPMTGNPLSDPNEPSKSPPSITSQAPGPTGAPPPEIEASKVDDPGDPGDAFDPQEIPRYEDETPYE